MAEFVLAVQTIMIQSLQRTRLPTVLAFCLCAWSPFRVSGAGTQALRFREVSSDWGLEFRHHHGGSGKYYMVETMGSGVVLFDFDNDGDTDVFFVDGGALPGYRGEPARSWLFRNDGGHRFVPVIEAGIDPTGYGMGAIAGDVDRDGDLDLYVTEFGRNELFLNQGDGTFRVVPRADEVADAAGEDYAGDPSWSTSAAFADVDLDGDLDLYVANYVDFTLATNRPCGDLSRGLRSYCHPDAYDGVPDSFWINDGHGVFSRATGAEPDGEPGKGLGVIFLDQDGDGMPDLYVANDMTANLLFRNRGQGRFEEEGLASGVAYSERGEPEAGMGVAAGDLDGDGQVEIFVTHLDRQSNALYGRREEGFYVDRRRAAGIVEPSYDKVGFGVVFADLDNDADFDVVVANGHIIHNIEEWETGSTYRQPNQIFINDGTGRLAEAAHAGLSVVRSSRGLATGDLDGDGDLDLVISNSNEESEVYENLTATRHWVEVALRGRASDRFGIGSRVRLSAGDRDQMLEMRTGSSYLSQNPLVLHFGVGDLDRIARLEILWPSGRRHQVRDLPAGRRFVFYESPAAEPATN